MGVLVPSVDVVLDRPRRLVEDFAALAAFEEATGLPANDPATFVKTVHRPPAPCPACGHKAKARLERLEVGAVVWVCKQCDERWLAAEKRDGLNATEFSAYLWALLLFDDPHVDLADVRHWLGDPKVMMRAKQAVIQLEIAEKARALAPDDIDDTPDGDDDPKSPRGMTSSGSQSATGG